MRAKDSGRCYCVFVFLVFLLDMKLEGFVTYERPERARSRGGKRG
jgi:hypothetical protein